MVMERISEYLSAAQIHQRIGELAVALAKEKTINAVVVLEGALPFYHALEKELHSHQAKVIPQYIRVKSYRGTASMGTVKVEQDVGGVEGKDLWVIEDIIDIGYTMDFVKKHLLGKGAQSVRICTLFHKKVKTKLPVMPDLVGFEVPDAFLVGFGLDYNGKYRELPYVGVLKQ